MQRRRDAVAPEARCGEILTVSVAHELIVLDAGLHDPVLIALAWLGCSIGMRAFPSRQDAASFTAQVQEAHGNGPTLLVARGFAGHRRQLVI